MNFSINELRLMKYLVCFSLAFLIANNLPIQSNNEEITNLIMIPNDFEGMEVIEEILEYAEDKEGLIGIKRSNAVFAPNGPAEYREVIEVHWESMEQMAQWGYHIRSEMTPEKGQKIAGIVNVYYGYQ